MSIIYRLVETHAEYRAAEQLQRAVWGGESICPDHLLITAQKNGGLVLGAFDEALPADEQLVGMLFGFLGRGKDRRLKHCSHLLAVRPSYRNRQVGELLKLHQREHVLAQGIDRITWTYDPIESRNAHLNIHKLGAVCTTYYRNLYGSMADELNAGIPSDRFEVDWFLASPRVEQHITHAARPTSLAILQDDVLMLNPIEDDQLAPSQLIHPPSGDQLLIRFPSDFQGLKSARPDLALSWRLQLRACCEAAFRDGYCVADLLRGDGLSYYLLVR
jgi:predicted GNAT superfamily acetyltransferase